MANLLAQESHCNKRKVGALIVCPNGLHVGGINTMPGGVTEPCEDVEGKSLSNVIHAEQDAIDAAVIQDLDITGATIYVTTAPCINCADKIIEVGITSVVFEDYFKNDVGITALTDAGVSVQHYKEDILYRC